MGMLSDLRRLLSYEMTLAEWFGTAVLLLAPYGAIGLVFAVLRPDFVTAVDGPAKVPAFGGTVLFWPLLLFADVCPP